MKVLALLFPLGLGGLMMTSCNGSTPVAPEADVVGGPLYTVARAEVTGGMCVDGPCSHTLEIFSDGRMNVSHEKDEVAHVGIDSATLNELADAIKSADIDSIPRRPADYTCPTAYDGTMTTYEFYGGSERIVVDSCDYDLSNFTPAVLVENEWRTIER